MADARKSSTQLSRPDPTRAIQDLPPAGAPNSAGFPALFGGSPSDRSGKLCRVRRPSGDGPENLMARLEFATLTRTITADALAHPTDLGPTLAKRREKLDEWTSRNRRPIDKAFVHSIFNRDHPGTVR